MNSEHYELPKNLVKFFRNFDTPQIVVLHLGSESSCEDRPSHQRFICNSIILALHSDKFERVISAGSQEIFLGGFDDEIGVETVRACIEFMYGDQSAIDWCDDICGMCKFADSWEIPSLWHACLKWIECQLHGNPVELLDYLDPTQKFVNLKLSQCAKMDALFDDITCSNADILIARILELRGKFDLNDKLFEKLVKNSKTSVCGEFIVFLLADSEETRKLVMRNLHILPVNTAFPSEALKLKLRNLLLHPPCFNGDNQNASTRIISNKCNTPADEFSESSLSHFVQQDNKSDDNASIMEFSIKAGDSGQSPKCVLTSSVSSSDKGKKNGASDDDDITSENYPIEKDTSSGAISVDETIPNIVRNQFFNPAASSIKDLPSKIKNLSLYSGLEAIAHRISKGNLNYKNLSFLLLPYFKNRMIAASVLEDIKCIALKRCSSQKYSIKESLSRTLEIDMKGRSETFSVSKYCFEFDMADFLHKLEIEKRISLYLDHGVVCQICHDESATTGKAKGKKSAKQMKCIFQGLEIDLSSNTSINIVVDEECHRDHLIHCYIVGLSADKTPLCYLSIMQLTVSEVLEELEDITYTGVKIVVVFSKTVHA